MNKTKIEYLTHSWNPLAMRCSPVSAGCANCWHLTMADRLAANPKMPEKLRQAYSGESAPVLVESRLDAPLKVEKPAVIGVQFMGDLSHGDVSFEFVKRIFDVMRKASQHIFLLLTKRPKRMLDFGWWLGASYRYPLPNVHLGVSVENQQAADERIPALLRIPAAVRFVSFEPLLGYVEPCNVKHKGLEINALTGETGTRTGWPGKKMERLDWVIAGAESGPNARPMDEDWVRHLRNQCIAAGTPFFYKQKMVNGRKVSLPALDGKVWDEVPGR